MFLMEGPSTLRKTLQVKTDDGMSESALFTANQEESWSEHDTTTRPGMALARDASPQRFALGARLSALENLLRCLSPTAAGEEMAARLHDAYARGAETLHVALHDATIDEVRQLLSIIGWTGEQFYMLHQDLGE